MRTRRAVPFTWGTVAWGAMALMLAGAMGRAERLKVGFPTGNDAFLTADPASFYQYVNRDFEGNHSRAWEGGQYGFVRDPRRFGTDVIYTRFHEGIDIQPLHRDTDGEPQDVVGAIGEGEVVYVNLQPAASNYGRYVVVQHNWDGCPYFSLYAHLKTVIVRAGVRVGPKAPLGSMGYSGEGLDRERAHLHLELNLMLNAAAIMPDAGIPAWDTTRLQPKRGRPALPGSNLPSRMSVTVFFDGECRLCNQVVNFLLREDQGQILKYAPLQGYTAKMCFRDHPNVQNQDRRNDFCLRVIPHPSRTPKRPSVPSSAGCGTRAADQTTRRSPIQPQEG